MLKKILLTVLLLASLPAFADSWDSRANILKATHDALRIYKERGVAGMVAASQSCYNGLDQSLRNRHAGRDTEYCLALEAASAQIDLSMFGVTTHAYFNDTLPRFMLVLEKGRIIATPEQAVQYADRFTIIKQELGRSM